jgi:NIMA (never in mitosis gene a)-related kinase
MKSLNILMTKDRVKIADMGVAKMLTDAQHFIQSKVGTPYYLSPEVCEDRPYNAKSDIWSLGCILYELCSLKHPFESNNQGELLRKIINGEFEAISKKYSQELREICYSCLTKNFSKRPSCQEIIAKPIFQAKANLWKIALPFRNTSQIERPVLPPLRAEGKLREAKDPPASHRQPIKR